MNDDTVRQAIKTKHRTWNFLPKVKAITDQVIGDSVVYPAGGGATTSDLASWRVASRFVS